MTRETDLFKHMMELANKYCAELNNGKTQKEISLLKESVKQATDDYNKEIEKRQYLEWAKQSNPVEIAIRERYIAKGCKAISFKTTSTGRYTVEVTDIKTLVNLSELSRYIDNRSFHSPDWSEKINCLLYLYLNAIIVVVYNGKLIRDSSLYNSVQRAVKVFSMADNADITSASSIQNALQQTIDAILFLPIKEKNNQEANRLKVTTHSFNFIWHCLVMHEKQPYELAISGAGRMTEWVTDIIYVLLTDNE